MGTYEANWVREHVNTMSKVYWNAPKLHTNCTKATKWTTLYLCGMLAENGFLFATEVKMKNGLRADIIVPEGVSCQVIEIMDTETIDLYDMNKKHHYTKSGIDVLKVPANPLLAWAMVEQHII